MAYADQKMSSGRVVAIIIVALIHAVLGYAFVTGLALNVVKKVAADMDVFDVEEPPPPPDEPPPPPPKQDVPPPPVVTPPPIVKTNTPPPPQIVQVNRPPPPTPVQVDKPVPPPPPPPPAIAKKGGPKGNPGNWVTNDDYPASAVRASESGTTGFRLTYDATGKVTNCDVTGSSGSPRLDQEACKLLLRRARFNPNVDTAGNKTGGTYSNRFKWVLPE